MGLIVPQIVEVKLNNSNYKHYKEKGYEFEKVKGSIIVNVLDLTKGSSIKVKCKCDFCGKDIQISYCDVVKNKKDGTLLCCNDTFCKNKKREDTSIKRYNVKSTNQLQYVKNKKEKTTKLHYGVNNPFQSEEVKKKIKETCIKNHGTEYPMQSNEVKKKSKETCKIKYGGNGSMCSKEVQDKMKATCKERYGVEYASKSKEIKNKVKKTCKERYGVNNPFQSKEIRDKAIITWNKNYGVDNPSKVQEIKDRKKETVYKNYGVDHQMHCDEVKNKIKLTNIERYGVEYVSQNEEIKNKIFDSFQFNGTGPSSRAQKYISYILNGILNKHICNSLVDIYLEKEKIVIEHDGSGHFLGDIIAGHKNGPSKEAILREKQREDKIVNKGYRMIRFIANKDRIPSDEVILNLIDGFKNSNFKVIRIDFEEGTIDRDYKEKWYCNFGKLRKITKKDLEKFNNTSETSEN